MSLLAVHCIQNSPLQASNLPTSSKMTAACICHCAVKCNIYYEALIYRRPHFPLQHTVRPPMSYHGMLFERSRSFKVIDFCTYRKPIHDFLLVINCDLNAISYRFRDIAPCSRKPATPPQFEPSPIKRILSNLLVTVKLLALKANAQFTTFQWKLQDFNFSNFVTIHSHSGETDRRHS